MSLQHHFVVVVEYGKLHIDEDTLNAKFWDGSVYDRNTTKWQPNYEHANENERARELLWDRINFGYDQLVKNLLDTISEMRSTGDYDDETLEAIEWKFSNPEGEDRILPYKKPATLPCQTCGVAVDKDTHKEELGFCVPCQHDYFDHKENA
jgi:hypothetical protein